MFLRLNTMPIAYEGEFEMKKSIPLQREGNSNDLIRAAYTAEPQCLLPKLIFLILSIIFLSLLLPAAANAHRGAKNEIDTCRFSVGSEVIHFSAYTPTFSDGESFCHSIPNIGDTHLVFDYEGNRLRKTTVEFEITKEPDGTRIFYQKPEKIKKGSVDAKINFNMPGAGIGHYLAHVTIMHKGEKLDSHLPFSVGMEPEDEGLSVVAIASIILAIIGLIVFTIMVRKFNANKAENI